MAYDFLGRTRILDYDEYVFDIDEYRDDDQNQFLLAHIAFETFNLSVWKRVRREWKLFRQCVTAPLYAYRTYSDVDKWEHFVSRLGFKPTGIFITCINGERRQLYLSTVSNEHKQIYNQCVVSDDPVETAERCAELRLQSSEDSVRHCVERDRTDRLHGADDTGPAFGVLEDVGDRGNEPRDRERVG